MLKKTPFFRNIRELFKYFKTAKKYKEITFYSESGIYFFYYKGLIETLLKKSHYHILYITSDIDDPVFKINNERLKVFYIDTLLQLFFPFISTKILVMTMPDLNKYHIKKTINEVNHIYVFHAINSMHMTYNKGAFDYYDTVFCVGPHHVEEIRKSEAIYDTPRKNLIEVGYSWLEEIHEKYKKHISMAVKSENEKVMIAPSWNSENILESCIHNIVPKLLSTGYSVVVRPHPEFVKRNKNIIDDIAIKYGNRENFLLETDLASDENWYNSSILITDWSGISFEFAWGMEKPVIFIDTPMKIHNPEYKALDIEPLEVRIRDKIGVVLKLDELDKIDSIISDILSYRERFKGELKLLREQSIFNWGRSSEVGADYIIDYLNKKQQENNKLPRRK